MIFVRTDGLKVLSFKHILMCLGCRCSEKSTIVQFGSNIQMVWKYTVLYITIPHLVEPFKNIPEMDWGEHLQGLAIYLQAKHCKPCFPAAFPWSQWQALTSLRRCIMPAAGLEQKGTGLAWIHLWTTANSTWTIMDFDSSLSWSETIQLAGRGTLHANMGKQFKNEGLRLVMKVVLFFFRICQEVIRFLQPVGNVRKNSF